MATPGPGRGVNWGAYGNLASILGRTGEAVYRGKAALGGGIGGGLAALGAGLERSEARRAAAAERSADRAESRDRWEAEMGYRQQRDARQDWEWDQGQAARAEQVRLDALGRQLEAAVSMGDQAGAERAYGAIQAVNGRLAARLGVQGAEGGGEWGPGLPIKAAPGQVDWQQMFAYNATGAGSGKALAAFDTSAIIEGSRAWTVPGGAPAGLGRAAVAEPDRDAAMAEVEAGIGPEVNEQRRLELIGDRIKSMRAEAAGKARSRNMRDVLDSRDLERKVKVLEGVYGPRLAALLSARDEEADAQARQARGLAYTERMEATRRRDERELAGQFSDIFKAQMQEERRGKEEEGKAAAKKAETAARVAAEQARFRNLVGPIAARSPEAAARVEELAGGIGRSEDVSQALSRLESEFPSGPKREERAGLDPRSYQDIARTALESVEQAGRPRRPGDAAPATLAVFKPEQLRAFLAEAPAGTPTAKAVEDYLKSIGQAVAPAPAKPAAGGAVEVVERDPVTGKYRLVK